LPGLISDERLGYTSASFTKVQRDARTTLNNKASN